MGLWSLVGNIEDGFDADLLADTVNWKDEFKYWHAMNYANYISNKSKNEFLSYTDMQYIKEVVNYIS